MAYSYDLPEQSEDEVWSAGVQVVGADVDDVAADGLGGVECQRQVLVDLIDVQFAAVQRSLVDRPRLRTVHHLAAYVVRHHRRRRRGQAPFIF